MKVTLQRGNITVVIIDSPKRVERYKDIGYKVISEEKIETVDDIIAHKVAEALALAGIKTTGTDAKTK